MIINRRTVLAAGLSALATRTGAQSQPIERDDLMRFFAPVGGNGAFAFQRGAVTTVVNLARAKQPMVPASTFKIPNALIALETVALADANEIIPYGGQPQPFKAWEKDMALAEAIKTSNVPIFQALARRIGLPAYVQWLAKFNYGNAQPGSNVEQFWLDGPLAISAIEQTSFLQRVATRTLPLSERSYSIARDCLKLETKGDRTIYAKTGWVASTTPRVGWWVGWIEDQTQPVATFAINMDMLSLEAAPKRVEIGKALLTELGVW